MRRSLVLFLALLQTPHALAFFQTVREQPLCEYGVFVRVKNASGSGPALDVYADLPDANFNNRTEAETRAHEIGAKGFIWKFQPGTPALGTWVPIREVLFPAGQIMWVFIVPRGFNGDDTLCFGQ